MILAGKLKYTAELYTFSEENQPLGLVCVVFHIVVCCLSPLQILSLLSKGTPATLWLLDWKYLK